MNSQTILGMLSELETNDLITIYTVEDQQFIQVTGWHHQRIDKPQKSRHPPIPEGQPKNVLPKEKEEARTRDRTSQKGSRWNGESVPEEWRTWAWEHSKVDVNLEADKFTDYWVGVSGSRGVKLNWKATWRNWIRKAGEISGDKSPLRTDHL